MKRKILFWDFDGTLGYRKTGMWGASMLQALIEYDPNTKLTAPDFRQFLMSGFPWHHPEKSYTYINSAEAWWEPIQRKFVEGFVHYGVPYVDAERLAVNTKTLFLDKSYWALFDDTLDTLDELKNLGWKHVIVSNHVPELGEIIEYLGLKHKIIDFVNSALVGYEKPNPSIFQHALSRSGNPKHVWMIGDNFDADVLGAERIGIRSILVRNTDSRAKYSCKKLKDVISIVESELKEGTNNS
ncbi:HAD family hydrolase [Paenibacillus dakarensis]|uniref:HAD family hydrolase n=1 Tax=Paenibacillus dakarensis TaxID=1527293 RepID=UPI0006D565C7|nr:HAD-IA family hydrolase [Paenibacillus dakarensis]